MGQAREIANEHVNMHQCVRRALYQLKLQSCPMHWACLTWHGPNGISNIATYLTLFVERIQNFTNSSVAKVSQVQIRSETANQSCTVVPSVKNGKQGKKRCWAVCRTISQHTNVRLRHPPSACYLHALFASVCSVFIRIVNYVPPFVCWLQCVSVILLFLVWNVGYCIILCCWLSRFLCYLSLSFFMWNVSKLKMLSVLPVLPGARGHVRWHLRLL